MDRLVDVYGLGLTTRGHRRVSGVDLLVKAGMVVGLVGPNGAGKTTILRMLAGLQRPTDGLGHVLGRDIRARRHTHDRPGYMPQSAPVHPSLSVAELLRYRATLCGNADTRAAVASILQRSGLEALAARRLGTLSGGWRRRVEFAATIVAQPRLLLLDEPTTGLDHDARAAIWELIGSLADAKAAIIVNTHDLLEAERCDHLLVLIDGAVVTSGSPATLMARTKKSRLDEAWPLFVADR